MARSGNRIYRRGDGAVNRRVEAGCPFPEELPVFLLSQAAATS